MGGQKQIILLIGITKNILICFFFQKLNKQKVEKVKIKFLIKLFLRLIFYYNYQLIKAFRKILGTFSQYLIYNKNHSKTLILL